MKRQLFVCTGMGKIFATAFNLHKIIKRYRNFIAIEKFAQPRKILLFPPQHLFIADFSAFNHDFGRTGNLPVADQFNQPQRKYQTPETAAVNITNRVLGFWQRPLGCKIRKPRYAEMCRRFLADCEDFSEEKIGDCGIIKRYANIELEQCVRQIKADIEEEIKKG